MTLRRWHLVAALIGTLAFGVYSFFNEEWMTHLPDGTVEDCIAAAPDQGLREPFGGGGEPTTSPPGLRCEVNGTTFVIPADAGDYVGLLLWSVMVGAPLGLVGGGLTRAVIGRRRRPDDPRLA